MLTFYVLSSTLPRYQCNTSFDQSETHSLPQQTLELASECFSGNSQELVSISVFPYLVFLNKSFKAFSLKLIWHAPHAAYFSITVRDL